MINHIPSKSARHFFRMHLKYNRRPRRYRRLLLAAERIRPKVVIEIGVFTGLRGVEVLDAASLGSSASDISYFGFDLFDLMDDDLLSSELSKRPDAISEIKNRLNTTSAQIELVRGFSNQTLPEFFKERPDLRADLIFIDGGHAIETIQSDWDDVEPYLSETGAILLDDYYVDCPHLTDRFGCNILIESLDRDKWDIVIHPEVDRFVHDGLPHNVSIVEVSRKKLDMPEK